MLTDLVMRVLDNHNKTIGLQIHFYYSRLAASDVKVVVVDCGRTV